MMDEPRVILMDLPPAYHGVTWHDDEGNCTILLNARDSWQRQREAYRHEVDHIKKGQLDDPGYIEYKE